MKKFIAFLVVVLMFWCAGIHVGKGLEREHAKKVRQARAERLQLFYKHKTERPAYQRYAEKITDVIGEVFN